MKEFDYLIIGAGSAGCVLANRLSADSHCSVVLVERGPRDKSPLIRMPRGFAKLMGHPKYSSTYQTGQIDGPDLERSPQFRGRVLGGSSAINGMIYWRGLPSDYNDWGCPGWEWPKMLAAFRQIEDHELGASEWRGSGGELGISCSPYRQVLCDAFMASANALGVQSVDDINTGIDEAVGYNPRNIRNGRRQSAAHAFLTPVINRPNLHIFTETEVERIVFAGTRAVGVKVRDQFGTGEIRARRDVILAAGAIETPKLLQLSGVGPASHLAKLGIPIVADSPQIGENLVDHRVVMMQFSTNGGSENREFQSWRLFRNLLRQQMFGTGPMSRPSFEVGSRIKSRPTVEYPDVQLFMGPFSQDYSLPKIAMASNPGASAGVVALRPQSRGRLRIRSANYSELPDIKFGFLQTEEDRAVALAGFKRLRQIFAQVPLQNFALKELYPGPSISSDDDILTYSKMSGASVQHMAGTCRMGVDTAAPVDTSLRVRGVQNLRVADISIMPQITSGNTNAPAMAIGQRASEIIIASSPAIYPGGANQKFAPPSRNSEEALNVGSRRS